MCWRLMLLAGVVAVTAYRFNANDDSEYIDNANDGLSINDSAANPDFATAVKKEDKIEDVIEKLLGQPVIQYEEPAIVIQSTDSAAAPAAAPSSRTTSPRKYTQPSKLTDIPHWSEAEGPGYRHRHTRARPRTSEVIYSVRVRGWDDDYPQIGQRFRPGVVESLVGAHDIVRFETRKYPTRPPYMHSMRHYPAETETTRTYTPTRTPGTTRTDRPQIMAEKNQTQADKNGSWPAAAYNEGGVRPASGETVHPGLGGRRQDNLLTLPAYLVTTRTLRPRPTPTFVTLATPYPFTRRTRKNMNCTDSYYECLFLCFDRKGYRVKCPWDTPTPRPEPQRMNFTGLFWAIQQEKRITEYEVSDIFWSWKDQLIQKGYRSCRTFTPRTTTTPKEYPIYYDDFMAKTTGTIMAKCWVCGLREQGIPRDADCYDNFANTGTGTALFKKSSYRKYCRYMEEVPLWFNRSDPFSVWGRWTGGCTYRYLDLSGLYAQRACRSTIYPATGEHFLSKRMASLELALRDQTDGCVVSPMASLVPFSRSISLYARIYVCVCRGNWCNRACHRAPSLTLLFILFVILRKLLC